MALTSDWVSLYHALIGSTPGARPWKTTFGASCQRTRVRDRESMIEEVRRLQRGLDHLGVADREHRLRLEHGAVLEDLTVRRSE